VITVRNPGARPLRIDASAAGLALSLRGTPRIGAGGRAASWLRIHPRHIRIAPRGTAVLSVAAAPPRRAEPGDHPAVLLLATRPSARAPVRVRLRVGVEVVLRVPGRIVRRLQPRGLVVRRSGRRRLLELHLVNRGDVSETLDGRRLRLLVVRGGRATAVLRPLRRELLPGARGICDFVYRGPIRGAVRVRLEVRGPSGGRVLLRRSFRVRL